MGLLGNFKKKAVLQNSLNQTYENPQKTDSLRRSDGDKSQRMAEIGMLVNKETQLL